MLSSSLATDGLAFVNSPTRYSRISHVVNDVIHHLRSAAGVECAADSIDIVVRSVLINGSRPVQANMLYLVFRALGPRFECFRGFERPRQFSAATARRSMCQSCWMKEQLPLWGWSNCRNEVFLDHNMSQITIAQIFASMKDERVVRLGLSKLANARPLCQPASHNSPCRLSESIFDWQDWVSGRQLTASLRTMSLKAVSNFCTPKFRMSKLIERASRWFSIRSIADQIGIVPC